jgi:acyl-CoA reductase-like NAD-dependent aldehyde dehydrogenase
VAAPRLADVDPASGATVAQVPLSGAAEVEAGMLGVNVGVPAPVAWFSFSGWNDSIDGDLHANGTDAVDFYTRKKVITTRW